MHALKPDKTPLTDLARLGTKRTSAISAVWSLTGESGMAEIAYFTIWSKMIRTGLCAALVLGAKIKVLRTWWLSARSS